MTPCEIPMDFHTISQGIDKVKARRIGVMVRCTRPDIASYYLVFCTMPSPPTNNPPRGGSRVQVRARVALLQARTNQMCFALLQALICWLSMHFLRLFHSVNIGLDGGWCDRGGPTAG